tara:strand:+ start:40002 stop:40628 length:627 start_codon:yes stop_codon:yes gene_type:complete
MGLYNKYILPKFLDCACSSKPVLYQRKKIIPYAEGEILEVGIGSGINIPYYNAEKVNKIWGLDPSKELLSLAQNKAGTSKLDISFINSGAERIPLPDSQIDTVVVTYTLCTIPVIAEAIIEIKRVLRPSGKLVFCEHGEAPDDNIRKWQQRVNPVWKKIAGGCNLNRPIPKIIKESGFEIKQIDQMYLPSTPKIAGYNYWGFAIPSAL